MTNVLREVCDNVLREVGKDGQKVPENVLLGRAKVRSVPSRLVAPCRASFHALHLFLRNDHHVVRSPDLPAGCCSRFRDLRVNLLSHRILVAREQIAVYASDRQRTAITHSLAVFRRGWTDGSLFPSSRCEPLCATTVS